MKEIECKEVIVSNLARRGKGIEHSPIRIITQVFEKDGTLIAEFDPAPETFAAMDLIHFARWIKELGLNADNSDIHTVSAWLTSIKNP